MRGIRRTSELVRWMKDPRSWTMYLTQILHRNARSAPNKSALVSEGVRLHHAGLSSGVSRLAARLRTEGVRAGDRVAILALNSAQYIEAFFATWWLGAVVCPVNTRWSADEILFSLTDCEARLLLVDVAHLPLLETLRERDAGLCPALALDEGLDTAPAGDPRLQAVGEGVEDARAGGGTLAAVLYTGGTTGHPKGVMLSHANLFSAALTRLADQPALSDSVALLCTPLFHVAAITRILPHLMAGGTVVILPQFRADSVLDLIEQEGVTDLPLVPSMLQMLLDHPAFDPERLRSLRRLAYGAAPASRALVERTLRLLPWAGFSQSYGMTESAAVGTMSHPQDHTSNGFADGRATSAGRPCSSVELRVVDPAGEPLPPNAVGEIVLRGPTVMPGYWRRPEETAQALRHGWLHTGDAGFLDSSGYLHVVDRIKDMIVSGGENVYSAEVENILAQHPAVSQCAVFAVPSSKWGEAVHAAVVLKDGQSADAAALIAHCRSRLAGYKCPKGVEFLAALPFTPTGKIAKNVLRAPYWEGRQRQVN